MLVSENPGASRKRVAWTAGSKFLSPHGGSAASVAARVEGCDSCLRSKRQAADHGKDHWPSQASPLSIPHTLPYANPLRHTEAVKTEKTSASEFSVSSLTKQGQPFKHRSVAEFACQFVPRNRVPTQLPPPRPGEQDGQALPFSGDQNASLAASLLKLVGAFCRVS